MRVAILAFCALLMSFTTPSMGAEKILREEKKVFGTEGCIPKPSCQSDAQIPGLKELGFWVKERQYISGITGDAGSFGSVLYAWYETLTRETIEDFAFVQYIRGCIFASIENEQGVVTNHFAVTRKHTGERKVYVHLDWEVDSGRIDPMYDSNPEYPLRHYFLEWNKTPEKFPQGQGFFYGDEPPTRPRLSMRHTANPSAHISSSDKSFAINHSLEYRTCLYRTADIPKSGSAVIPGALACFDWKSSHVYNHKSARYESPDGIVQACKPETVPALNGPW